MGCDIHMVVEKHVKGSWVAWNTMSSHNGRDGFSFPSATDRNYTRFSKLAGVRGEGPEAKGVPEDASQTTRALVDDWGSDGHSHSHIEIDEACRIFLATEYKEFEPDSHEAKYPSNHYFNVESEDADGDEYRLVFWFDN